MTAAMDRTALMQLAKELRASPGTRQAVMLGKNVSYIKGPKLVAFLLQQHKRMSAEDAAKVGSQLLRARLVIKADLADAKRKTLRPAHPTSTSTAAGEDAFDAKFFYVWNFEGSTGMRNLLLMGVVLAFFGLVLFPVWPQKAKVGVWYASMTLLLLLFGFILGRLVLFLVLYAVGVDLWILPNFFADDMGIAESLRPVYSLAYGVGNVKQTWPYRLAMVGLVFSIGYWIYTQPTEFDEFVAQQRQFVDELYEGTLLSDKSQKDKDGIDQLLHGMGGGARGAIPAAEQVEKELDELEKLVGMEEEQEESEKEEERIAKLVEEEEKEE